MARRIALSVRGLGVCIVVPVRGTHAQEEGRVHEADEKLYGELMGQRSNYSRPVPMCTSALSHRVNCIIIETVVLFGHVSAYAQASSANGCGPTRGPQTSRLE